MFWICPWISFHEYIYAKIILNYNIITTDYGKCLKKIFLRKYKMMRWYFPGGKFKQMKSYDKCLQQIVFFLKQLLNFNWHLNGNSTNIKSDTTKDAFKVVLTLLGISLVTPFCSIVWQRTLKITLLGAFNITLQEKETRWAQELSVRDCWLPSRVQHTVFLTMFVLFHLYTFYFTNVTTLQPVRGSWSVGLLAKTLH